MQTSVGWEWGGDGLTQQWDEDGEGGGTHSALSPFPPPPRALLDPVVSPALLVLL